MKPALIVAALLAALLGVVQFASVAAYSRAGTALSLPHHLRCESGVRIYSILAKVLPPAFSSVPAAECALGRGDLGGAQAIVETLAPSATRSDLAGRIESARGRSGAAALSFVDAGDVDKVEGIVDARMRSGNDAGAFALESALRHRMLREGEHPNAVADIDWKLNVLAARLSRTRGNDRNDWLKKALTFDRESLALSPFAERYYLAQGNRQLELQRARDASQTFAAILQINPGSADAYAGMGLAAQQLHNRGLAQLDAQKSASLSPDSTMLRVLYRQLKTTSPPPRNP